MPEVATVLGYGHRLLESATKLSPSKDKKSLTPVSQSSKKTRAMVAQSREDGKKV